MFIFNTFYLMFVFWNLTKMRQIVMMSVRDFFKALAEN